MPLPDPSSQTSSPPRTPGAEDETVFLPPNLLPTSSPVMEACSLIRPVEGASPPPVPTGIPSGSGPSSVPRSSNAVDFQCVAGAQGKSVSLFEQPDNMFSVSETRELLSAVPETNGSDISVLIKFILEVESLISTPFVSQPILLRCLVFKIVDPMRTWWVRELARHFSWAPLKEALFNNFVTPIDRAILAERFLNRRQGPSEDFADFINDILKYVPLFGPALSETELVAKIWMNQNASTFNFLQYQKVPDNIEDLIRLGQHMRVIARQWANYDSLPMSSTVPGPARFNCFYCKQKGHLIANCPIRPLKSGPTTRAIQPKDS